jgi:hypothetical protein
MILTESVSGDFCAVSCLEENVRFVDQNEGIPCRSA